MSRSPVPLGASALVLVLTLPLATPAQQVQWSYNWEPSTLSLVADAPGSTGGITFTDEPTENASGNSNIVVTNLRTFSTATSKDPDHFINASYGLTLVLTDNMTHQSGTLHFGGVLHGLFSAVYANIRNTYTKPSTQSLNLGGDLFTVTIGPYAPPGVPTSHNAGSIAAFVLVTPKQTGGGGGGGSGGGTGGPPPGGGSGGGQQLSPEPSTLALSCLGLSYLGFASWRRRRQQG